MYDRIELIKSRFSYWPESGKVFYKAQDFGQNPTPRQKQWNSRFANKEAGYVSENGYIRVSIDGKQFYAHQIAFALMTGGIPNEIDHINLNKADNKWSNLRIAEHHQNASNAFKRCTNKSGFKGVSWSKSNKRWRMEISHRGKVYFGYFLTKEEAYESYCAYAEVLHKEYRNVK